MSLKKNRQRQQAKFGAYITDLRIKVHMGMAEAAKELGFRDRQRLANYERGRTIPRYPTLLKIAQLYKVPLDEIVRKAYWPQLILLPIDFLVNVDKLSSEDFIMQIENGLHKAEREELTQVIEEILHRRITVK